LLARKGKETLVRVPLGRPGLVISLCRWIRIRPHRSWRRLIDLFRPRAEAASSNPVHTPPSPPSLPPAPALACAASQIHPRRRRQPRRALVLPPSASFAGSIGAPSRRARDPAAPPRHGGHGGGRRRGGGRPEAADARGGGAEAQHRLRLLPRLAPHLQEGTPPPRRSIYIPV
jgi:hypothetical protein